MIRKITITLDLEKLGMVNTHFYVHNKALFVDTIINYTSDKIWYMAILDRDEFIDNMHLIEKKKLEIFNKYQIQYFDIISIQKKEKKYRVLILQTFPDTIRKIIAKYQDSVFLIPPFYITKHIMKINLLDIGKASNLLQFLEKFKVNYHINKIISVSNLNEKKLTTKQRKLLELAYESGYFDTPKKVTLNMLSEFLGVSASAIQKMLKRIEKKSIEFFLDNYI